MKPSKEHDITGLLAELAAGNADAASQLMPLLYGELRRLASGYMRREMPGHTLQSTALVHEAFLRLMGQRDLPLRNRGHFFALAAHLMRQILVDHARARNAQKRGGKMRPVDLETAPVVSPAPPPFLAELDDALRRLAERSPRQSQVVEMRFFGGLTDVETAAVLNVSVRTVKRDWAMAKTWLYLEMNK